MEAFKKLTKLKEHLQNLTREEAYSITREILENNLSVPKTAAFLTAMRIKGETQEELMGIYGAVKEKVRPARAIPHALDLATNYDGKVKSLYILPSAIAIACQSGLEITYHYAEKVPAKFGTTLFEVMKALDSDFKFKNYRFAVIHQKEFCPKLYKLLPLRRELGFRTFFNVLEKLLNPFGTKFLITSLFHKPYFKKLDELCSGLGFESFTLVKGVEGGIEPFPDRPTFYKLKGREVSKIEPSSFNMELPKNISTSRVLEDSLELNRHVLTGKADKKFTNWAVYTAALLLLAGGKATDFQRAIDTAKNSYTDILNPRDTL